MIPLTVNPSVAILLDNSGKVIGVASNIAPIAELNVEVTSDPKAFEDMALGKSFCEIRVI
jgi:hypothetical protein